MLIEISYPHELLTDECLKLENQAIRKLLVNGTFTRYVPPNSVEHSSENDISHVLCIKHYFIGYLIFP